MFQKLNKYPRTYYLPFSPGIDRPDQVVHLPDFLGKIFAITIKMDGSNATMTSEHIAARNGQDALHPSFNALKAIHAIYKNQLHGQWFGEWLWAKHSELLTEGQLSP